MYKRQIHDIPKVYAVQLIDKRQLIESTSGGMFTAVAGYVFDRRGVVFGAVYDENMQVKHTMAENMTELAPMRGSKYIQSDISECYFMIKKQLNEGRLVLFSGLPCQVAGVYAFLGKRYDNLITMDLICSGVPSQRLFDSYIKYIEKKNKIKILDYKFRDKHKYGLSHTVVITYKRKNGNIKTKTIKDRTTVSYYVAFGKQNCFMDTCYNCKYNSIRRISDMTVGGFWSIGKTESKLNEKEGVSLVLANTDKAIEIIKSLKGIALIEEHSIDIAVIGNNALVQQTDKNKKDDDLYNDLSAKGYKKTSARHFKRRNCLYKIAGKLYRMIKNQQ